jgi:hypothetical protein
VIIDAVSAVSRGICHRRQMSKIRVEQGKRQEET